MRTHARSRSSERGRARNEMRWDVRMQQESFARRDGVLGSVAGEGCQRPTTYEHQCRDLRLAWTDVSPTRMTCGFGAGLRISP